MLELKPGQIRPTGTAIIHVDPEAVLTSPYQARETYSDLDQLADSLLSEGQQIPIRIWFTPSNQDVSTATDGNRTYRIFCHDGNRRLAAFKMALEKDPSSILLSKGIKAVVIPEIGNEADALISQYTLNNTSRSFNAIEEATIVSKLIKAGYTQQEAGDKLGKSQQWVANTMKLLTYSDSVKQLIKDDQLSASLAISMLREAEDKEELENQIVESASNGQKVTRSRLTGIDKRKTKGKKKPKATQALLNTDTDDLSLSDAVQALLKTTRSIKAVSDTEISIIVPTELWGKLEELLD